MGLQAEEYIQDFLKAPNWNMRKHFGHLSCFQKRDILEINMNLKLVMTIMFKLHGYCTEMA